MLKWVANPERERNGPGIKSRPQICTKSLKTVHTLWPSNSTSRNLSSQNSWVSGPRSICKALSFTLLKNWKQHNCPARLNKLQHRHVGTYHITMKNRDVDICLLTETAVSHAFAEWEKSLCWNSIYDMIVDVLKQINNIPVVVSEVHTSGTHQNFGSRLLDHYLCVVGLEIIFICLFPHLSQKAVHLYLALFFFQFYWRITNLQHCIK